MTTRHEIHLPDGRSLVAYDAGAPKRSDQLTVVWHHGSPHTGVLYEPLLSLAAERGIRLVTYARPSYRGSSPDEGRSVGSAGADVSALADALGIERFAGMGASGGGPRALACASLLGDRVSATVTFASPAPYTDAFDWFAGMAAPEALQAARAGRTARARFAEIEEFNEAVFTEADWAALRGAWAAVGQDAGRASSDGPDGLIDDDVAFAKPWQVDVSAITTPVLLVQGGADRMIPASHAESLLGQISSAELWLRPRDGHVSVLDAADVAFDWILDRGRKEEF
ncbi:MAG: alpha/beta hydrolase [Chloroflexi bacterium]|nr:alpha/beta hydrolase [Chloroflexota bacterium]